MTRARHAVSEPVLEAVGDADAFPQAYFSMDALSTTCIYLIAMAWPLGAYQRILGPLHLHHAAFLPILLQTFLYWRHNNRLQVPFELFWPCAAIAALAVLFRLLGYPVPWLSLCGLSVVFVATYQMVRNRACIWTAMQLSLLSGIVMLFLSVLSRQNWVFPTTFSVQSGLVLAGPYAVSEGFFSLFVLVLTSFVLGAACVANEYPRKRLFAVSCVFLLLLLSVYFLLPSRVALPLGLPTHSIFLFPVFFLMLPALWGVARTAAKLLVAIDPVPRRVAITTALATLAGAGVAMAGGILPGSGVIFLLALGAARSKPALNCQIPSWTPWAAVAPLVALCILNFTMVLPGDPRNYEIASLEALARSDHEQLRKRLEFIKGLAPGESRADYYIARSYLAEGNMWEAATHFAAATRNVGPARLLPAPADGEIQTFLNEMRDLSSSLPESVRGLAYEKSLIASGRERHALSLLELRGDGRDWSGLGGMSMAAALATIINAPQLQPALAEWNPGLLASILETGGPLNEILPAPDGFPEQHLPCVVILLPTDASTTVLVFTPSGGAGGIQKHEGPRPAFSDMTYLFLETGWGEWQQQEEGGWKLVFGTSVEVNIGTGAAVRFLSDLKIPHNYPALGWETRVYVPGRYGGHD